MHRCEDGWQSSRMSHTTWMTYFLVAPKPDGIFLKLQFLRVLDMHGRGIKELPDSIENLKQLRFLDLTSTEIKVLSMSIAKLYNLQTLKLNDCNLLRVLPEGVTKLTNLRHLEASTRLVSKISGIGNLKCLQELEEFVVTKNQGHRITELRNMAELRGHLSIRGLNNVPTREEADGAKLSTKENLQALHLIWEDSRGIASEHENILEGFQPHAEIKELMIKGYAGTKFPSWLDSSFLPNLQTIHICSCRSRVLPPLGQLPFLRCLDIGGAIEVRELGREFSGIGEVRGFPSLNELVLEDMPKLRAWVFDDGIQLFPQLTDLGLVNCPQLKELPPLPSTLMRLRISEAGLESLPELHDAFCPSALTSLYIHDCPNLTSLREGLLEHDLGALESLKIANCEGLVSLPEECFRPLLSLRSLHIYNCPCLVPWTTLEGGLLPSSVEDICLSSCSPLACVLLNGLNYLPHLKLFKIEDCPDITNFPPDGLPLTLEFLAISHCDDLQCLPPRLFELSSLETLMISHCPEIDSLPEEGLPRNLRELYIKECRSIKQHCLGGQDRVKIAHVRDIEIDGEVVVSE